MPDRAREWLVEKGIGEERAVLLDGDEIIAARLHWPGGLVAGQVDDATVVDLSSHDGQRRSGIVRFACGQLAHASRLPRDASEGSKVRVEVTRESIAERGRLKLAQARFSERDLAIPDLVEQIRATGEEARIVHRFPRETDWEGLWSEAWTGDVEFPGGSLILSDTPAMTVIDVDLHGQFEALYHDGLPVLANTLSRMQIAGNIGIDFPTVGKQDRKAVDVRLEELLDGWPHERTSMNGFGFVQIVARMTQPSLLQRLSRDRAGAAARLALRRAERLEGAGAILMSVHPAVEAKILPEWRDELVRRTGRQLRIVTDPTLALEAAHAQIVSV